MLRQYTSIICYHLLLQCKPTTPDYMLQHRTRYVYLGAQILYMFARCGAGNVYFSPGGKSSCSYRHARTQFSCGCTYTASGWKSKASIMSSASFFFLRRLFSSACKRSAW